MAIEFHTGDSLDILKTLAPESVQCCVTSPPYFHLRDYGQAGQIGLEDSPEEYAESLVSVLREVRRVLRPDGLCFLNLGDSYAANRSRQVPDSKHRDVGNSMGARVPVGYKPKDLMMIPFLVALAAQADGWWIRSVIPWVKRNVMPESVRDRPVASTEYVFMLAKSEKYFWNPTAVLVPATGAKRRRGGDRFGGISHIDRGQHSEGAEFHGSRTRAMRNGDILLESLSTPHGLVTDLEDFPLALDVRTHSFRGAHFATFPPALVTPLLRGATGAGGCCANCGVPLSPVLDRQVSTVESYNYAGSAHVGRNRGMEGREGKYIGATEMIVGWEKHCGCGGESTVPSKALDCFSGAGTVGLVAETLGLDSILIDINPGYHDLARARIDAWKQTGKLL